MSGPAAAGSAAAGAAPRIEDGSSPGVATAARPAPKFLFVPVSGEYGMGEYARCAAIAQAVVRRWQGAGVHFVLSRKAPYAAGAPFPKTLLASSPTFHSAALIELMESLRPDVVIFDNAGRTAQLRAARRLGARVVYVSARRRQRNKAFRWRWMRLLDEHWIAYPPFIAGRLGFLERLKLSVLKRPRLRYLDVILAREDSAAGDAILSGTGCAVGTYVLVVPGGGTGHPGAVDAVGEFATAARALARRGVPTIFVAPADSHGARNGAAAGTAASAGAGTDIGTGRADDPAGEDGWHPLGPLPQPALAALMRSARLIIANGGSTLLQAIACGNACVAVPIARDQAERTRRCAAAGAAVAAALDHASIAQAADRLLRNESLRLALARRAAALGLADGTEVAVRALEHLLERGPGAAPAARARRR